MQNSLFSRAEGFYLIVIYCGFFGFSLAIFGIHFIYRYGAINKDFWKRYLEGDRIYLLFSLPVIYFLIWAFVCFFFFIMDEQTDQYMRVTILKSYDLEIKETSYICVLFWPLDKNNEIYPDYLIFIAIGVCWLEIATSMWAVFYFGIKCFIKIRNALHHTNTISHVTKNLQQQLFQALVVQTCIPLILMYIPIGILFFFPMINFDIGFTSSFVAITIAIYPAIDPLPNMFIIKSYRQAIFEFGRMVVLCFTTNARQAQCTNQCALDVSGMESVKPQSIKYIVS